MFNLLEKLIKYSKELKVLLIEDNEDACKHTCNVLKRFFSGVDVAKNGIEGLALYEQNLYDIIITNINMPEMNGIEMTHKIREANYEQKIIAITASHESHLLIDLIRAGFNSFALKPIEPNEFFMTLYPFVKDAYIQKINTKLLTAIKEQDQKLKNMAQELALKNKTIDMKHKQVEMLLRAKEQSRHVS